MPFGEVVCGSPGSGKSTYCYGKHQLFIPLNQPISIVNLDPANEFLPYPCAIDISELITLAGQLFVCRVYIPGNYSSRHCHKGSGYSTMKLSNSNH
jgi:hypothetical protein